MTIPRRIGITGPAGAGKTTLANLLKEEIQSAIEERVWIIPFAQPLKELARELGWDGKKDDKGRRLLQLLGTEVCRECIDPDYWISRWMDLVIPVAEYIIIADDVRFENEAKAIRDMDGVIFHINASFPEYTQLIKPAKNHMSEQGIEFVGGNDLWIHNDGSMEGLTAEAKEKINYFLVNEIKMDADMLSKKKVAKKVAKKFMDKYILDAMRTDPELSDNDNNFSDRAYNISQILHGAMGICTEAGELMDIVKKHLIYNKQVDVVNLKEELGDILWYMAIILFDIDSSFEEVAEMNIDKLRARYPDKFTPEHAVSRNLGREREVLEKSDYDATCFRKD